MKEEYNFSLTYDTKETEEHIIDAEELGKSILSMSAAIKEGDKILNGEDSEAKVTVKAHKESSFEIAFVTWLSSGGINVLQVLGIGVASTVAASSVVLEVIKQLKNRKIKAKVKIENSNNWILQLDDGEEVKCSNEVEKLIDNYSIRQKLDSVVTNPTKDDKTAIIKFKTPESDKVLIIEPDEIKAFKAPPRKSLTEVTEITKETNIVFVQVNFDAKTGWKVRLPNNDEKIVRMEDEAFIERINKRERSFIKGDMFSVKLKTISTNLNGKVSIKRIIEEVIRHRVAEDKKIM